MRRNFNLLTGERTCCEGSAWWLLYYRNTRTKRNLVACLIEMADLMSELPTVTRTWPRSTTKSLSLFEPGEEPRRTDRTMSPGIRLDRLDRDEEAVADYDEALSLEESAEARIDILINRSRLLLYLKRHEEALASSDEAIALLHSCPHHEYRLAFGSIPPSGGVCHLDRDAGGSRRVRCRRAAARSRPSDVLAPRAVRMRATLLEVLGLHEKAAEGYDDAASRYRDLGDTNMFAASIQRAGESRCDWSSLPTLGPPGPLSRFSRTAKRKMKRLPPFA